MKTKRALFFFTCSVPLVWAAYPFTAARPAHSTAHVGVAEETRAESASKSIGVASYSPRAIASPSRPEPGRHAHAHTSASLSLAVDGAKTPDAIPDSLAYRHFLMITAEPAVAEPKQISRRSALLARVGLTPPDRAAYFSALAGVREQLNTIEQQLVRIRSDVVAVDALRRQRDQTLESAGVRVRSSLSPDGARLLDRHIREYVKRGIVIYGEPR